VGVAVSAANDEGANRMLATNTAKIVLEYPDVFFIYTPVLKDGLIKIIFSEGINEWQD
jgi:hypothetical protein